MPKLALTHTNSGQEQQEDFALETNDRGQRLPEFGRSHQITLANTLHPHKLSRTATWHAPNGHIHKLEELLQLTAFILTPKRFKSSIIKANTRSFLGADIGSDHNLVLTIIKLKLKTKRFTKSPRIRFGLKKLKASNIAEVLQLKCSRLRQVDIFQPSVSLTAVQTPLRTV